MCHNKGTNFLNEAPLPTSQPFGAVWGHTPSMRVGKVNPRPQRSTQSSQSLINNWREQRLLAAMGGVEKGGGPRRQRRCSRGAYFGARRRTGSLSCSHPVCISKRGVTQHTHTICERERGSWPCESWPFTGWRMRPTLYYPRSLTHKSEFLTFKICLWVWNIICELCICMNRTLLSCDFAAATPKYWTRTCTAEREREALILFAHLHLNHCVFFFTRAVSFHMVTCERCAIKILNALVDLNWDRASERMKLTFGQKCIDGNSKRLRGFSRFGYSTWEFRIILFC
jgi:hypothetical protein